MRRSSINFCKHLFLLCFLTFFSICETHAQAEHKLEILDGNQKVSGVKSQWAFLKTKDNIELLWLQVLFQTQNSRQVTSMEGEGVYWDPQWNKPGQIRFALGGLRSTLKVRFNDGSEKIFSLQLSLLKSVIREKGCQSLGFKIIESKKNTQPVFLGLACSSLQDKVLVYMSNPQEWSLDTSTIFETAGKGERWKVYEVSRSNLKGTKNEIARFNYSYEAKKLLYSLQVEAKSSAAASEAPKPKKVELAGGLSVGSLSVKDDAGSVAKSSIGFLFNLQTQPLFWKMIASAQFQYLAPMAKASLLELEAGIGPRFSLGSKSALGLELIYIVLNQDQELDGKSLSLRHSQVGLILNSKIGIGESSAIGLRLRSTGFGAKTTDMSLGLDYMKLSSDGSFWSVGLVSQSQTAKANASTYKFGQTILQTMFSF